MARLILACGPDPLGMAFFGGAVIASASILVAIPVWWLSRPAKLSSANGCVSPILITLAVLFSNFGAAALWFKTDWTIAGPVREVLQPWRLLALLVLPGAIGGVIYVAVRRSSRLRPGAAA